MDVLLIPRLDTTGSLLRVTAGLLQAFDRDRLVVADFGRSDRLGDQHWSQTLSAETVLLQAPEQRCCQSVYAKMLNPEMLHAAHPARGTHAYDVALFQALPLIAWYRAQAEVDLRMGRFKGVYVPPAVGWGVWPAYATERYEPVEWGATLERLGLVAADAVIVESPMVKAAIAARLGPLDEPSVKQAMRGAAVCHPGCGDVSMTLKHVGREMHVLFVGYVQDAYTDGWILEACSALGVRYGNVIGIDLVWRRSRASERFGGLMWHERMEREAYLRFMAEGPYNVGIGCVQGETYSIRLFEMISCGVLPLIQRGSVEAMLPDGYPLVYADSTRLMQLLLYLREHLTEVYERWMPRLQAHVRAEHSTAQNSVRLRAMLREVIRVHVAGWSFGPSWEQMAERLGERYGCGDEVAERQLLSQLSAMTRSGDPLDGTGYATPNFSRALLWRAGFEPLEGELWQKTV